MKREPRLLLTSVMKPLGPAYGDAESVGYELLHAQVTRAQGMFSPRAVHRQYLAVVVGALVSGGTANLAIDRGLGGQNVAKDYDDASVPGCPARWSSNGIAMVAPYLWATVPAPRPIPVVTWSLPLTASSSVPLNGSWTPRWRVTRPTAVQLL